MDENCNPQNHRGYLDTHQALIRDRENSLQDYKSDTRHQSSCCQINSKSKITVCPGGYFLLVIHLTSKRGCGRIFSYRDIVEQLLELLVTEVV